MDLNLSTKTVSGISIIEIYNPDLKKPAPLIILIHGFSSKKEDMLSFGLEFAKEGYYTCMIDAYNHGELNFKKLEITNLVLKDILTIYDETINSINVLIDSYKRNELIDIDQVGLFGTSMGGTIILKYLTDNYKENIKVAIPVITTAIWSNIIQIVIDNLENTDNLNPDDQKFLNDKDKNHILNKIKKIPMLLLNGDNDELIPIKKVLYDYNQLKKLYFNKETINLISYPGLGHQVNMDMIKESKLWFKRFFYK